MAVSKNETWKLLRFKQKATCKERKQSVHTPCTGAIPFHIYRNNSIPTDKALTRLLQAKFHSNLEVGMELRLHKACQRSLNGIAPVKGFVFLLHLGKLKKIKLL